MGVGVGSMEVASTPVGLQGHKGASFSGCVPGQGITMCPHTPALRTRHTAGAREDGKNVQIELGEKPPLLCKVPPALSTDNC